MTQLLSNDRAAQRQDGPLAAAPTEVEVHAFGLNQGHRNSRLMEDWYRLFELDRAASIHHHPEMVRVELAARKKAGAECLLILARQCGKPLGLAILLPEHRQRVLLGLPWQPFQMKAFRLSGGRPLGIAADGLLPLLFDSIQQKMEDEGTGVLIVDDVEAGSEMEGLLGEEGKGRVCLFPYGFQTHVRLRFPENSGSYWSTFSRSTRKKLNKLRRLGSHFSVRRYENPNDVAEFLGAASEISRRSWQSRRMGIRVPDDEIQLGKLTVMALQGVLRSYILWDGSRPVAFEIMHQRHGYVWCEEAGFDSDYAASSPGRFLQVAILDDLFDERKPDLLDFLGGDAFYKRQFGNELGHSGTTWMVMNTLPGRVNALSIRCSLRLKVMLHDALNRIGLSQFVRRAARKVPGSCQISSTDRGGACP